ncbi:hypothetical protein HanRHA438_Chr14g0633671 [Helianthus annuus]|uniref:Transmembrane protein n=1 Tax=Helianthus annuus TaxID=4232 RepID=A0A9K3H616_HELAN|nr:uncharacterized protein LOC110905323 [Helianthus annuus]KAF5767383.1 hypothetical protein HanXRQr2_Chr14g0623721 [Helianthus annuus]KAJ0484293.1 hypothetical protein HanHA89_Chr14g0542521 [Helianthus annuus]KAJ0658586.1 hypothetical protein HanOQP8_Chr14g0509911 [Helianthus annuus]KAJ0702277.1 hypothetical protein HanPI659440_Chr14g0527591 [Helianthus annuus]KAJ0838756.1 hypothetical protein HanPSC8_Chr14g0598561 [Helianthus annuus]
MSLGTLPIVLLVIFALSTVALIGSCLFVLWRRRSFHHRSSPAPPIRSRDATVNFFNFEAATKELQYFFRLKPLEPVELDPHDPPVKDTGGSSPDDQVVVDVFKLEEVHGLSRFLSTIKEDKEEVESTPDVDFSIKPVEVEEEDGVGVMVDEEVGHTKTVFSTPCDSPVFFTPVGSPLRDVMEPPVFIVSGP